MSDSNASSGKPPEPEDADLVSMAQRHVIEAEERVARQKAAIEELNRDGHPAAATLAEASLRGMEATLELARRHLRTEMRTPRQWGGEAEGTIPAGQPEAHQAQDESNRIILLARRHVAEAERHVAQQKAIIEQLERDGHKRALGLAREVLKTLQHSLLVAREHLQLEEGQSRPKTLVAGSDGGAGRETGGE